MRIVHAATGQPRPLRSRMAGIGDLAQGDVLGLDQAVPRRAALSGIFRIPAGARGAGGTRNPAERHAPYQLADALRAALFADMRFESDTPTSRPAGDGDAPQMKGRRPAWLIRLGLFLYDHLGGAKILPGTRSAGSDQLIAGDPLKPASHGLGIFRDCWVQDCGWWC